MDVKDIKLKDGKPLIETKVSGIMRVNTSRFCVNPKLVDKEDRSYHKNCFFYPTSLGNKPEFSFQNHELQSLKEKDVKLLCEDLTKHEEKLKALKSPEPEVKAPVPTKGGKAAPAKKDAKPAAKKDAKGEDDKNAPKNIEIESVQIESEPNCLILEKNFKVSTMPVVEKKAPVAAAATLADKKDATELKKEARLADLKKVYKAIRALPFSVAVVLKLNVPEEVKIEKEPSKASIEPAKKGAKAAPAKKK